ncbi:hypothetical protein AJ80_03014 [Polytolypa hystricis UAMH7299]|uniref:Uncharacterized protein n=1 Tax=Polytolypa hystricis (strain UAMH7299) TaxID=1447883 RepID=A0A2B7YNT6_POLH7|nr:hypothetical protein AJ80_03014 [Polytolypa hystricis UAMH7299]
MQDFFYVCPIHLKDRGFCSPIIDEAEVAEMKRKEEMEREIEKVKKEYEEKMKRKKQKKKDNDKSEDKDKKSDSAGDSNDKKDEKEKDEKIKSIQAGETTPKTDDEPRIFALHKHFYQMRIDRIRNMEMAKRNRERLNNPSYFPSTPKSDV